MIHETFSHTFANNLYIHKSYIIYVGILWCSISLEIKRKTALLKEIILSVLSPGWSLFLVDSAPSFFLSWLEGRYFVFFFPIMPQGSLLSHSFWHYLALAEFSVLSMTFVWAPFVLFVNVVHPRYDLTAVEILTQRVWIASVRLHSRQVRQCLSLILSLTGLPRAVWQLGGRMAPIEHRYLTCCHSHYGLSRFLWAVLAA